MKKYEKRLVEILSLIVGVVLMIPLVYERAFNYPVISFLTGLFIILIAFFHRTLRYK